MLTKTIKYTDYNGNPREDKLRFNMTKVEIARMQVKQDGAFIDNLRSLAEENHVEQLFEEFCNLVLNSYGEMAEDGVHFIKTPEMRADFETSIAFSELMAELIGDTKKIAAFTRAIIPADLMNKLPSDEELVKGLPTKG